jgi:hypothetical protein
MGTVIAPSFAILPKLNRWVVPIANLTVTEEVGGDVG